MRRNPLAHFGARPPPGKWREYQRRDSQTYTGNGEGGRAIGVGKTDEDRGKGNNDDSAAQKKERQGTRRVL